MIEDSQLRSGGPDAPERHTDSDFVGRAGKIIERYKIFYVLLVALLAWWGRNVVIPLRESAQTTTEVRLINRKLDSVLVPRMDRADSATSHLIELQRISTMQLGILVRLQCLRTSAIDRVKIDLNCKDIPIEFPKAAGGF
jgi:hypothetical protein